MLMRKWAFQQTEIEYILIREAFKKKTVKRVTLSLKVGRWMTKNHILFEEKNSDMEGRYKNKFCYEIYGFLEKWFLDEAII